MEKELFREILAFIDNLFSYYIYKGNQHDERIAKRQQDAILRSLSALSDGKEHEMISFSLDLRSAEKLRYYSFKIAEDHIEISEGGSVYDPCVGSDSFTLWTFILRNTGEAEGQLLFDYSKAAEMINLGAGITVAFPEELSEEGIALELANDEEKEFLDGLLYSYELLMSRLSEPIVKRLVYKVKRILQSFGRDSDMMQSPEDCPLINVWDELCVQEQGEQSIFYDIYIDTTERIIMECLKECLEDEKIILWTQTQDYEEWRDDFDCTDSMGQLSIFPDLLKQSFYSDRLKQRYNEDEVCDYILHKVLSEACNYRSKRIEEYLY